MASVSSISTISKVFSKLGDNTGSVIPMFAKDSISNGLISYTYTKDSSKTEGIERAIEEFGTGIIWLGGIPFVKKIFDKIAYKNSEINPNVDAKRLFAKKDSADSLEFITNEAKKAGEKFSEQTEILDIALQNKGKAKKLALSKFGISTAMTALMMFGLITLKQKRTKDQIEKEVKENYNKEQALQNKAPRDTVYQAFTSKDKGNEPSFTGAMDVASFFMTNPVANTAIVDGVIVSTRLAGARKGERGEISFKEACQLIFIYALAHPLQKGLEFLSNKLFKRPIELDYPVLDSSVIKNAIEAKKANPNSFGLLEQAKELINIAGQDKKVSGENAKKVVEYIVQNSDNEMVEILKKSGIVGTFKTKEGIEQISLMGNINAKKVKKAAQSTVELIEKAIKKSDVTKYLKETKFFKGAAILANIGISAFLIGYVQPKVNLYLRKKKNNGDNTNPAIKNLENEMKHKMAFEGKI